MEPELFKTLGGIAGIGGIALGVVFLLFRDVIGRSIFPQAHQRAGLQAARTPHGSGVVDRHHWRARLGVSARR
jgi:hypothetical protein